MKIYTYSEAQKQLPKVLEAARKEEVLIKKRNGETFRVTRELPASAAKSPFDVPGIRTRATTGDILRAVRESRSGEAGE